MTDEAKLRQQIERAERAKRILESELVLAFFQDYEKSIWEKFKESSVNDEAGHRNCRMHMMVLGDFKKHFEHHVNTGEMAKTLWQQMKQKVRHG